MATKQRTRTDFLALTISAGGGTEDRTEHGIRNRYTVQVQSDATGQTIRFEYHDSIAHNHVDQLDARELLFAFWSFVQDATAGDQSFADFAGDYGYDVDSISAKRTWEQCKAAHAKFGRLWHDAERFTPDYVLEQLAHQGIE